jgi:hypothetical protein
MLTARQGSRQITLVNRGGLTKSARWLTMLTNRVSGLGLGDATPAPSSLLSARFRRRSMRP